MYSSFKDNIWSADLAKMQLISKFNKGFWFVLCVIDIMCYYLFLVPLKDKRGITIVDVNAATWCKLEKYEKTKKMWKINKSSLKIYFWNWKWNRNWKCFYQNEASCTRIASFTPSCYYCKITEILYFCAPKNFLYFKTKAQLILFI